MKKIIFFLLFANFCFSQGKELTISQIDSICLANGKYGNSDGQIKVENEKNQLIGFGGSYIKTYVNYYNQKYYNSLNREEKKRYIRENDSELIRADLNQNILYKNNDQENIFAQFYYYKDQLFYLKLKIKKNEIVLNSNLNQSEIESENDIKNELNFELKKWIIEKNQEILKFHNK